MQFSTIKICRTHTIELNDLSDADQKAELRRNKKLAIQMDDAKVAGSIDLTRARILGRASLARMRISGRLLLRRLHIKDPDWCEIAKYRKLWRAIDEKSRTTGLDESTRARIEELDKNWLLGMQGSHVTGDIQLDESRILGRIICTSIEVGGRFSARRTIFCYPIGTALNLDGVTVHDDIRLDGVRVIGQVDAAASYAKGQLVAYEGEFHHPSTVLRFDRAHINGGAIFERSQIFGVFQAHSSRFAFVDFSGAKCISLLPKGAIDLSNATIDVSVDLTPWIPSKGDKQCTYIIGSVSLEHSRIGSLIDVSKAVFTAINPKYHRVDFDVDGSRPQTPIRTLSDGDPICISLRWAKIDGVLRTSDVTYRDGNFDLRGAQVDTIEDDVESGWPKLKDKGLLRLDGLIYRDLKISGEKDANGDVPPIPSHENKTNGDVTAKDRINWLLRAYPDGKPDKKKNPFRPQPFQQLIKVMRIRGHDSDARLVEIKKRQLQLEYVDSGPEWFVNSVLRITSQFGHSPRRAILFYLSYVTVGTGLAKLALSNGMIEAASTDFQIEDTPLHMEPITYAFDLTTPIFNFGQATAYRLKPACLFDATYSFCGALEVVEFVYSIIGMTLFSICKHLPVLFVAPRRFLVRRLHCQNCFFARNAPAVIMHGAGRQDHPVTRNKDGDHIGADSRSDSAGGPRRANFPRNRHR